MNLQFLAIALSLTVGVAVFALILGFRLNSKKIVREQELDSLIDSIVQSEIELERKDAGAPKKNTWFGYWYSLGLGAGGDTENPTRLGYLAAGAALVAFAIGGFAWPRDVVAAIAFPIIALVVLNLFLRFSATKRMAKLDSQLPSLLSGMRANLQANMTAQQSLLAVIDDIQGPLGAELEGVRDDIELGVPLDTALANLANRVPSDELRFLISSMRIAIVSGADLNPLLKTIQDIVVQRTHIASKLAAAVAQVQPTIWVTAIVIPGSFLFSYFSDTKTQKFWGTLPGIIALLVVAGFYGISLFVSKKQVDRVKNS